MPRTHRSEELEIEIQMAIQLPLEQLLDRLQQQLRVTWVNHIDLESANVWVMAQIPLDLVSDLAWRYCRDQHLSVSCPKDLQRGVYSRAKILRLGVRENMPKEIDAIGVDKYSLLAPGNHIRDVQIE